MENSDEKDRRKRLFERLDVVLNVSEKKFKKRTKDEKKLGWGRLIVNAVNAYGRLLDADELKQRVEKLEEQIKDSVVIPNEQKPKR